MSDTSKNDDNSEFRDPTAPREPDRPADEYTSDESTREVTWSSEQPADTQRIGGGQTEQLPTAPPGGSVPPPPGPVSDIQGPASAGTGPSYGTPAVPPPGGAAVPPPGAQPPSPYASPVGPQQGPGAQSPGPYGQAPQSPYAQRPGYPYAQGPAVGGPPPPPYGGQPPQPGYGYGPGQYAAPARQTHGSGLALTIVSGVSLALGACLTAIPALILGIMALAKQGTSPADADKYARWGWIAYAIGVVLYILAVIGIIAFIAATASSTTMYG